jgi:hypothetical protein
MKKQDKLPKRELDGGRNKLNPAHLSMRPSTMSVLQEIYDLRINRGWPEHKIKIYLMGDRHSYSERMAFYYLQYLRDYIKENVNVDREEMMATHLQQLETMASDLKETNPKLYLEYMREINKLTGLYEPQKVDITTGGDKINKITVEIITRENKKE